MFNLANGPFPHTVVRGIKDPKLKPADVEKTLRKLCSGNLMTNFSMKKKPEQRTFVVDLDARQVLWSSRTAQLEGSLNIHEIKEIRSGKTSSFFEKFQDDARKLDSKVCFSILYGNEFNLRVLSIAAKLPEDCKTWCRGLSYLVINTLTAPNTVQIRRYLQREFNQIAKKNPKKAGESPKFSFKLNCAKPWIATINGKSLTNNQVKSIFQAVDSSKKGELLFPKFVEFYYELMYKEQEAVLSFVEQYSSDKLRFNAHDFSKFLRDEQKEPWAQDVTAVKRYMNNYINDVQRRGDHVCFDKKEMLSYLFSKENSIWDQELLQKPREELFDEPLSRYWISSSHNTYLTAGQVQGLSSCECYARALRMGCRCVELDCWDGSDGSPLIYHGYTLVTRIKYLDVLTTIRDHAFVTSDMPVILSIENHCKLPQQRIMARAFRDVFKNSLLVKPVSSDESQLPSPNQLRRKIIIKFKKLDDANRSTETITDNPSDAADFNNNVKCGLMYLEDPVRKEWKSHFFILTEDLKLLYSEAKSISSTDDAEESETETSSPNCANEYKNELHYSETWYHGTASRESANSLLQNYRGPEGSFLVRDSQHYPGDYTLSFKYKNGVQHCHIHQDTANRKKSYYLVPAAPFDSLYSLICYYQKTPLQNKNFGFTQKLTDPIPEAEAHETKEWYFGTMSRIQADSILERTNVIGTFLVRKCKSDDPNIIAFAISFCADGMIKHCRIKQEGRLFMIGNATFESLVDVVNYYRDNPLYRKHTLQHPVTRPMAANLSKEPSSPINGVSSSHSSRQPELSVRAIYGYNAQQPDEMTIYQNAIITNVRKDERGWWRGDLNGQVDKLFPSNYVEEIAGTPPELPSRGENKISNNNDLGDSQKDNVDLTNCEIELLTEKDVGRPNSFRVRPSSGKSLQLACNDKKDVAEWVMALQEMKNKQDLLKKSVKVDKQENKVAIELSDLVVYCRAVTYREEGARHCFEMSSFGELKAEKMANRDKAKFFSQYNRLQLSRIYPKGTRVDSSNYDPLPTWNSGSQLVALNFQTGDRPMQLNQARFEMYDRCGFVLQDTCMHDPGYDAFKENSLKKVDALIFNIQIIAARHLPKVGNGPTSPHVEVEIQGCEYDNAKAKTPKRDDNGLNPCWDWTSTSDCLFSFHVHNPATAFLRFTVYDNDVFGDPNFVATSVIPIPCVKTGIRSVPLKNSYSEEIPLASLLVSVDKRNAKEEDENICSAISMLREQMSDFQVKLSQPNLSSFDMMKYQQQLNETQKAIFSQNERRVERNNQKLKRTGPKK